MQHPPDVDVVGPFDVEHQVRERVRGKECLALAERHVEDIFFASDEELQTFIDMVTPAKGYLPTFELQRSFIAELTAAYRDAIPAKYGGKRYVSYTVKTLLAGPATSPSLTPSLSCASPGQLRKESMSLAQPHLSEARRQVLHKLQMEGIEPRPQSRQD